MRRRQFIRLISGAAATAWPLTAHSQQGRPIPRVGELTVALSTSPNEGAFRQGLRDLGYVEGQNLTIDFKTAEFKTELLDRLAAELVAAKVDVIFSSGSEATTAVRSRTTSIPIVMTSTNPVGLGFVTSLARPRQHYRLEYLWPRSCWETIRSSQDTRSRNRQGCRVLESKRSGCAIFAKRDSGGWCGAEHRAAIYRSAHR